MTSTFDRSLVITQCHYFIFCSIIHFSRSVHTHGLIPQSCPMLHYQRHLLRPLFLRLHENHNFLLPASAPKLFTEHSTDPPKQLGVLLQLDPPQTHLRPPPSLSFSFLSSLPYRPLPRTLHPFIKARRGVCTGNRCHGRVSSAAAQLVTPYIRRPGASHQREHRGAGKAGRQSGRKRLVKLNFTSYSLKTFFSASFFSICTFSLSLAGLFPCRLV